MTTGRILSLIFTLGIGVFAFWGIISTVGDINSKQEQIDEYEQQAIEAQVELPEDADEFYVEEFEARKLSSAERGLIGVMPYFFIAVIIMTMMRAVFGTGGTTRAGGGFVVKLNGFFGGMPNSQYTRKYFERRSIYDGRDVFGSN